MGGGGGSTDRDTSGQGKVVFGQKWTPFSHKISYVFLIDITIFKRGMSIHLSLSYHEIFLKG